MRLDRAVRGLTVLTPVWPGDEGELAATLAALPEGREGPFQRLSSTHFARFVVIGELPAGFPGAPWPPQPLRMHYLLFTSTFNGPVRRYVEELRVGLGPAADAIWGHCVNYPGHDRAEPFRRYLLHNRLPVRLMFRAYDATVPEVRAALGLRTRHIAFARSAQGLDARSLQAEFLKGFSP